MDDEPVRVFLMTDAEAAWMNDALRMLADYYEGIPAIRELQQRFYRDIKAQRNAQIAIEDARKDG